MNQDPPKPLTPDNLRDAYLACYPRCAAAFAASLPSWYEMFDKAFHVKVTLREFYGALDSLRTDDPKEQPAFGTVKDRIWRRRQAAHRATQEQRAPSVQCQHCHGTGYIECLATDNHKGRLRLLDPNQPAGISARAVYVVLQPCLCAAGDACNRETRAGCKGGDAAPVRVFNYPEAKAKRVFACRTTRLQQLTYFRETERMYREDHGLEPFIPTTALPNGPLEEAIQRILDRAQGPQVNDDTAQAVMGEDDGNEWATGGREE